MSTPAIIMWAIVFAVGMPSAWRNPTAAALVIAWIVGQVVYTITGDNLSVQYYIFPDIFVLAVIFTKQEHVCLFPYRNRWHQLKCLLLERSPCDRIIILIFLAMWGLYVVADMHPYYKWWSLYWLALAQFLFAGWESFLNFRRAHTAASDTPETTTDDECRYAWSRGYG